MISRTDLKCSCNPGDPLSVRCVGLANLTWPAELTIKAKLALWKVSTDLQMVWGGCAGGAEDYLWSEIRRLYPHQIKQ